jgi:hypothetical protein
MTLVVHSFGAYASYSRQDYAWRPDDYGVNRVVKALKGERINGYADVRGADGIVRRITAGGREAALATFVAWGVTQVPNAFALPVILVPVPCSQCVQFQNASAPRAMADSLAARFNGWALVGPWLRFERPMPSSHTGGGRNQAAIEGALVVDTAAVVRDSNVVLIDDVKTTGAHLRACAAALRKAGCRVHTVLVAASTVWQPVADPYRVDPVDLEVNPFADLLQGL